MLQNRWDVRVEIVGQMMGKVDRAEEVNWEVRNTLKNWGDLRAHSVDWKKFINWVPNDEKIHNSQFTSATIIELVGQISISHVCSTIRQQSAQDVVTT